MTHYNRRTAVMAALATVLTLATACAEKRVPRMSVSRRNKNLDLILAHAMPGIEQHWQACREAGMEAMNQTTTDAVDAAIRAYFEGLKALGDQPTEAQILNEMRHLYEKLNRLDAASQHGLIESDERDFLVPIFIDAAIACGINPQDYDGEPGGEYRDF